MGNFISRQLYKAMHFRSVAHAFSGSMTGDVLLTLITRLIMIGGGVISAIITAHMLGAAGRGEYVYITTLGLLAAQIANVGISTGNARNAAMDSGLTGSLAGNSLWASLTLGFAATVAMTLYHLASGNDSSWTTLIVLMILVPATLYGLFVSNILLGLGLIRRFNIYVLTTALLQIIATAGAAFFTKDANFVLWANAIAVFISSIGLWLSFKKDGHKVNSFDFSIFQKGFGYLGRIYVINFLGFAISRANVLMLEQLSESRDVGIYSVAMQFADALMLLPSTIAMILFPRLVKTTDGSTFSHTVRTALWTATLLSVPVLILGLFAPQIILILFGAEFAPAAAALRALLPGVFAIGVATIFSQFISARGAPKSNVAIWLAASIIIVACNALLIPSFRSTGAGIALSICYGFAAAALIGLAFTMRKEPRTP